MLIGTTWARYQNVEISDGLSSSTQGTSRGDLLNAGHFREKLFDLLCCAFSRVKKKASGDAAILLDAPEDSLLMLLSHARKFSDFSFTTWPLFTSIALYQLPSSFWLFFR